MESRPDLILDGEGLTCRRLAEAAARPAPSVALAPAARARLVAARGVVTRAVAAGEAVYGLTTGLGARATQRLPFTTARPARYLRFAFPQPAVPAPAIAVAEIGAFR